jgi:tRNA-dihydrouridine synthase C
MSPRYAPGRLKQWLAMLTRSYPEATELFNLLRRENDCLRIDGLLGIQFVDAPTHQSASA